MIAAIIIIIVVIIVIYYFIISCVGSLSWGWLGPSSWVQGIMLINGLAWWYNKGFRGHMTLLANVPSSPALSKQRSVDAFFMSCIQYILKLFIPSTWCTPKSAQIVWTTQWISTNKTRLFASTEWESEGDQRPRGARDPLQALLLPQSNCSPYSWYWSVFLGFKLDVSGIVTLYTFVSGLSSLLWVVIVCSFLLLSKIPSCE